MKPPPKAELVPTAPDELASEPPVVARLIVEIRSDGTRTIARGALEDLVRGEHAAIEARGTSPFQLAIALTRALTQLPGVTARRALRAALGRPEESGKPRRGLFGRRRDR